MVQIVEMIKKATVAIEDTFKITGRGIVFVGKLIEGDFGIGDNISFSMNGKQKTRKIIGVEMIKIRKPIDKIGILIKTENQEEIEALRLWNPNGTIGLIF